MNFYNKEQATIISTIKKHACKHVTKVLDNRIDEQENDIIKIYSYLYAYWII